MERNGKREKYISLFPHRKREKRFKMVATMS
jgi:hypothetical protein